MRAVAHRDDAASETADRSRAIGPGDVVVAAGLHGLGITLRPGIFPWRG